MELGQRIKELRQSMGLSQRQLCGDVITRNMLSQIENGSAKPSMATLSYLASRLEKPVSFFLDEDTVTSPNQAVMTRAREAYEKGEYSRSAKELEYYAAPDATFDWEKELLHNLLCLAQAEAALAENRQPYAQYLLDGMTQETPYGALTEEKRRWMRNEFSPNIDVILLRKAQEALEQKDYSRAAHCLGAVENQAQNKWHYAMGQMLLATEQPEKAWEHLKRAEADFAPKIYPLLEKCSIAREDYKMAYHYACLQKK